MKNILRLLIHKLSNSSCGFQKKYITKIYYILFFEFVNQQVFLNSDNFFYKIDIMFDLIGRIGHNFTVRSSSLSIRDKYIH